MISKEEKQKIRKKVGSVLSTLVLAVTILLCLMVMFQVFTKGYVQIGGMSLFRIVTGSMEPELPVGTLVMCNKTDINEIEVNDIVCFRSLDEKIYGEIVTHRVVGITVADGGETMLVTQGDANLSADTQYVTYRNLIGKVNYYSKESGIVDILSDKVGFMILVLVPTLLIAGFVLRSCMSNIRKELDKIKEETDRQEQLYTDEEYAAMLARIRDELVEEMKHDVEESAEKGENTSKTE